MIPVLSTIPIKVLCNTCISTLRTRSFCFPDLSFSTHHTVLSLFHEKLQTNHQLALLLQACSKSRSIDATKSLHALTVTLGTIQPLFVNNNLVSAYASFHEITVARKVFDQMPERNSVSYNSIIGAYTRLGDGVEAWKLFGEMMCLRFIPTQFTFGSLLACASLDLYQGFQLQSLIFKIGLLWVDAFAGTALLNLFGRYGCLDEAVKLFEQMPCRNLVTWNSIISAFGQNGLIGQSIFLFRALLGTGIRPSNYTFLGVLSGIGLVPESKAGEQVHGLVIKTGADFDASIANCLVSMSVKSSDVDLVEKVFEKLPFRDVVSWNIIIGTIARSERPSKALELFMKMSVEGVLPNHTTFVAVVNSCTSLNIRNYGEYIHSKIIKNNFESDTFVGSALIDFYAKCNSLEEAHLCFDEIYDKNVVCWNALLSGYSMKGTSVSVYLLREMLHLNYCPNEFSFSAVLKSSLVFELQQLHSLIIRMGYYQNKYVLSSLIASYAINGLINDASIFVTASDTLLPVVPTNILAGIYNRTNQYKEAQDLLSKLEEPDNVSWNILIAACAHNGDYREGFQLFKRMQMAQIRPDNYTVVSLLCICTKLCNLAMGSAIHGLIIKTRFKCYDLFVCNILIDMYGKCGSLKSSMNIFNEMTGRNLISWTALISALGLHGYAHEAVKRFREMECVGFRPDSVSFVAVLSACRHGGLVEEGMELFGRMKGTYGVEPEMDHYVCVVDLLARYGHLKEAEQLICRIPFQPNALLWRTFLEGYKRCNNVEEQSVGHEIEGGG